MKNGLIIAGAAVAVWVLLQYASKQKDGEPVKYWATAQGNTGFPDEARTGSGGGVWI